MAQRNLACLLAFLVVVTPLVAAQPPLLGGLFAVQSSDASVNANEALVENTGLKFNPDGSVAAVLNGVSLLTIPGVNVKSFSTSPISGWTIFSPTPGQAPAPESTSKAVDIQIAATDLPGYISALQSIDLDSAQEGRKLKL